MNFTIEGLPKGKGRPRFTRSGHTYTPDTTRKYEALVTARAKEAMIGKRKIEKPNAVRVDSSPSSLCPRHGLRNAAQRLYQIIDGRIKNGRPTILVTNLDRSELVNLLTERVVSRVIQSSYKLFFTGRCRREPTRRSAEEVF